MRELRPKTEKEIVLDLCKQRLEEIEEIRKNKHG
jgi:hypothetical protein